MRWVTRASAVGVLVALAGADPAHAREQVLTPAASAGAVEGGAAPPFRAAPPSKAAPPFEAVPLSKAAPLGAGASATLRAESRLRYDVSDRAGHQGLYRGIVGLDVRANPHLRVFAEIGTARSVGRPGVGANFQNDAALQQLFLDARQHVGPALVGAVVGRQEFAEGPRQLVSVADGPNLHRTWNGVRLYAQERTMRFGAFDLRGTRLERGIFDDGINAAERLRGLNASLAGAPGQGGSLFLEPFWFRSESPSFSTGGGTGPDDRDSYGLRLWGAREATSFDWVLARQTGRSLGRDVDAWGLFAAQTLALSDQGWKPRLGARLDLASGGAAARAGFNQLYASSSYVSEGLFLSTSNLLLLAPSLSLAPTATTSLSLEYGLARRLVEDDAAYAGLMRAYAGTENVPGHEIGGLLRVAGSWSATERLGLGFAYEHLAAGEVLQRAGVPAGHYGYVRTTFRY